MRFLFTLILLFLMAALPAVASESAWVSVTTKAGISLSYRYSPALEVKASAFYPGAPERFLLLLQDTKSVRRWLKQSKDARLLPGSANPGGDLPDWLVKQLALSSLRSSFIAFKTELKRPAYQRETTVLIR